MVAFLRRIIRLQGYLLAHFGCFSFFYFLFVLLSGCASGLILEFKNMFGLDTGNQYFVNTPTMRLARASHLADIIRTLPNACH